MSTVELSVSQFVAVFNQTLELAYPSVTIVGELANFRVSKNRWIYFDLKDEQAVVRCFGTVYMLPGPLEDGMLLRVEAQPRLHALYGFSLNVLNLRPSGEGTIKRAAKLLQAKLEAEGLFDPARKRVLPYPPTSIGLITSAESAAYSDFLKVLGHRWGGLNIELADVQVQGDLAIEQVVMAVEDFNQSISPPEVLVLIRGGGSADDLAAFSSEQVTRAVAASRIPTLVAIGHERDVSLAELAADKRASTPSNAAELLVPDKAQRLHLLSVQVRQLDDQIAYIFNSKLEQLSVFKDQLQQAVDSVLENCKRSLDRRHELLKLLNPQAIISRGYAVVRSASGQLLTNVAGLKLSDIVEVSLRDGRFRAAVNEINEQN